MIFHRRSAPQKTDGALPLVFFGTGTPKCIRLLFRYPLFTFFLFLLVFLIHAPMDNDTFWLLAAGRSIAADGIPFTDTLTMHGDMALVQQQWPVALLYDRIFSASGYAGLGILQLLLNMGICLAVFALCAEFGGDTDGAFLVGGVSATVLIISYGVLRPQSFTALVFAAELLALERFRKSGKAIHLAVLPVLSALLVNLHASMWPMLLVFMAPLLCERILRKLSRPIFKERAEEVCEEKLPFPCGDGSLWQPAVCFVLCVLAGFANPYGLSAMTYLFRSYGVPEIDGMVGEMGPLSIESYSVLLIILFLAFRLLGRKKTPFCHLGLFLGTMYLALSHLKGGLEFLLAGMPVIAGQLPDFSFRDIREKTAALFPARKKEKKEKKKDNTSGLLNFVCTAYCFAVLLISFVLPFQDAADGIMERKAPDGVNYALAYAEARTDIRKDSRVFAGYNTGGYLEYAGYRPFLDARAEVFLKANNGKEDILTEYEDACGSCESAESLLKKYAFDYIFVYRESHISDVLHSDRLDYRLLYSVSEDPDIPEDSRKFYTFALELWEKTDKPS